MEHEDVFSSLEELLPGLHNDVTLSHIATKSPWKMLSVLSAVSTSWHKAIRSRLVYDTRVRSQSTETVVVVTQDDPEQGKYISLYSMRDQTFCDLPPIPHLELGISWSWKVISLDGKIYALGGPFEVPCSNDSAHKSVYMLDLAAGLSEWKKLTNMLEGRRYFGCGVLSDKIYVFGGLSDEGRPMPLSEMYDPKYNKWSPIKAMIYGQVFNEVLTMGEELLLHGGYGERPFSYCQVYHPVTDEWRAVPRSLDTEKRSVFILQGKLHSITALGLQVYDIDTNSWRHQHSMSWDLLGENRHFNLEEPVLTLHANNELLAIMRWTTNRYSCESGIVQSIGFSSERREILWQKVQHPRDLLGGLFQPFMGTIQL